MSGLKFALSNVASFLPDNLFGTEISIFRSEAITLVWQNELVRIIFTKYWEIYRSSYRKLVWMGFGPTTTEFGSDAKANILK